jgi:AAHS family 4-hydroxybenzoate transporter-like MFS transporter
MTRISEATGTAAAASVSRHALERNDSAAKLVADGIDCRPMGAMQWRTLALCALVAMIDGFDLQVISFVAPVVARSYAIGSEMMGAILAAALAGLMVGAMLSSPISDRRGRKPTIILSCLLMGIFSLATVTADSAWDFLLYRFLTGVGLGGVLPNIQTMTAEMVPGRKRALMMTIMFLGFPMGAIIGGLASSHLIESLGWQSVFIAGGVIPLLLVPLLLLAMPESLRWLAEKQPDHKLVSRYLAGATSRHRYADDLVLSAPAKEAAAVAGHPLAKPHLLVTCALWLLFFANLMLLYTMLTWLPSLMEQVGLSLAHAIRATVLFNLGGAVGGLILAWSMDRIGATRALMVAYLAGIVLLPALAFMQLEGPALLVAILIVGAPVAGTPFGISALAASIYATSVRARGLGWSLAVGRTGAVIGPLAAGFALNHVDPWDFIYLATLPCILCLFALLVLQRILLRRGER